MLGQIVSGIVGMVESGKQSREAKKIRAEAQNIRKEELRPEFQNKLNLDSYLALQGMAGYENLLANADANTAMNIRAIKDSSGTGTSTLNAISAAQMLNRQTQADYAVQNAAAKQEGQQRVGDTMWNIGTQERALELERTRKIEQQLAAAAAMENAATANKVSSVGNIAGGIESLAVTAATMGMGGAAGGALGGAGGLGSIGGSLANSVLKSSPITPSATAAVGNAGQLISPSTTTTNAPLGGMELQQVIQQLITNGEAKTPSEAISLLKSKYGFTINGI